MRLLSVAVFTILTNIAVAQLSAIPACAIPCFQKALQGSVCDSFDFYCQCTKGSKQISQDTLQCLCAAHSCSTTELIQVGQASENICSAALASSSETYTPATTLGAHACQSPDTGPRSSAIIPGNATASTTVSVGGNSASASASGATSSSTVAPAGGAAPTNMAIFGYQGAVLGLAGLAVLAL